jgi:ABC-type lipopolysaccharide export system ATPase subunit|tara:strand:- start:6 stop:407 length:402 start_codon:yes stop_codon:yes gene_type:complete
MSILGSLIGPATQILDKVIEDKDQKAKLAHELATMADTHAQQALLAQLEINKAEAASGSLFKGGWRPAVGWTCALAFLYHFIIKDLIIFGASFAGVELPELPEFDMGTLLTVLGGMLGIGSLRTYEKQKGLTK